MNKTAWLILFCLACGLNSAKSFPRLVVVISYDQMRGDFVERWSKNYGEGGFNLLRNEGAFFASAFYSHAKNITSCGHSVLLTGCNPAKTGIVGEYFIDDACQCERYCVEDAASKIYGAEAKMGLSPAQLATPTFGDALAAKFPKSKIASVAMKSKSAILMGGRKAKTVLWFEPETGGFSSSTYYDLPNWLESFNRRYNCRRSAGWSWQAELPDGARDDVEFEDNLPGGGRVFPHIIPANEKDSNFLQAVWHTPRAVELTFTAAKSIITEEKLGSDNQPDLLCIGVSTTDLVGHRFGPDSRETEELYAHCDRVLTSFIEFLDKRIGRANYALVVSSDHGVAPIPEVIRSYGSPPADAGRIPYRVPIEAIERRLDSIYGRRGDGSAWVQLFDAPTIYLNKPKIESAGISLPECVKEALKAVRAIKELPYTAEVEELRAGKTPDGWPEEFARLARNDIFPGRSGQIVVFPKQYWLYDSLGTSHGAFYDYDRFVPMIFFGGEIAPKRVEKKVDPADIAPTLAALVGVSLQNADGTARVEIIKGQTPQKHKVNGKKR